MLIQVVVGCRSSRKLTHGLDTILLLLDAIATVAAFNIGAEVEDAAYKVLGVCVVEVRAIDISEEDVDPKRGTPQSVPMMESIQGAPSA